MSSESLETLILDLDSGDSLGNEPAVIQPLERQISTDFPFQSIELTIMEETTTDRENHESRFSFVIPNRNISLPDNSNSTNENFANDFLNDVSPYESTPVQPFGEDTSSPDSDNVDQANPNENTPVANFTTCYLGAFTKLVLPTSVQMENNYTNGCFMVFRKILLVVMCIAGALQSLQYIKFHFLINKPIGKQEEKLDYYITLGYYLNTMIFKFYFVYVIFFKQRKVQHMLVTLSQATELYVVSDETRKMMQFTVMFVIMVSFTTAIAQPILESFEQDGLTVQEILLTRSYYLSITLFAWNQANANDTLRILSVQYGHHPSVRNLFMGALDLGINILGILQERLIIDFSLLSAITMCHLPLSFILVLKNSSHVTSQSGADDICFSQIWKQYKTLRSFSETLEATFGLLFQFLHVDNLLFCAYFLVYSIVLNSSYTFVVFSFFNLIKIFIFYFASAKASSVNGYFQKWITSNFPGTLSPFYERSSRVSTAALLFDLVANPIGVGTSMFFIDKTFFWKFTSAVGSYFVFFTNTRAAVNVSDS